MSRKLTDDEVLYATNEVIQQLEERLQELLERYRGKTVKGYSKKTFRVDEVVYLHGSVWVRGFIFRKDGSTGSFRFGVVLDDAEFV